MGGGAAFGSRSTRFELLLYVNLAERGSSDVRFVRLVPLILVFGDEVIYIRFPSCVAFFPTLYAADHC